MQALKVLVAVMGVLIVAGLAVIGVTLVKRIGGEGPAPPAAAVPALGAASLAKGGLGGAQFGDKTVELPKNGRLTGVHTEAGRLVLRVLLPGSREMLIVLDLATGERLGTINVNPAP
jgi:hypothetical protein